MENPISHKFEIVLVPFPFDDFTTVKLRPALIISGTISIYRHMVVAFISSKVEKDMLQSDIYLKDDFPGYSESGLKLSSVIKLHRIVTIPENIISKRLGKLPLGFHSVVNEKLKTLFEL